MTIRFYVRSIAKRAKAIALLDSGATENFMSLGYARWLQLPIKRLSQPQPLYNVDGSENKSRRLQFYTDLQIQTGQQTTNLRFFLSWESRRPYLDTPGSPHSNHVLIGKEDGSILLNFRSYLVHPMLQRQNTHTDCKDISIIQENDTLLDE